MFSTDFIFRQQENLVDNQKYQAGFRPLCNKILLSANDFYMVFFEIGHSASARKETDRVARPSVVVELLEAAKKGKRPPFFSS